MAEEMGCEGMMDALSIEESSQRTGHLLGRCATDVATSADAVDERQEGPTSESVTASAKRPKKPQSEFMRGGVAKVRLESAWIRRMGRCCVICGYHAPHGMLMQVHLRSCRKTSSWPVLYQSCSPDRGGALDAAFDME